MLARVKMDPTLTKEAAIVLPIMSFEYHGYSYDNDRMLKTVNRHVRKSDDVNKFYYQYVPVPQDLSFSLYVYVKNAEDGTKIVEQILPYFRPEFTAQLYLVDDLDLAFKVPLVLNSCTVEDKFEGPEVQRRALVWTLNFTMKSWLFGPIKKAPIIKFANTRYFVGDPSENPAPVEYVATTPGLLPNGEPTSNAAASISPLLIDLDDDWTYAIQKGILITE